MRGGIWKFSPASALPPSAPLRPVSWQGRLLRSPRAPVRAPLLFLVGFKSHHTHISHATLPFSISMPVSRVPSPRGT